MCLKHNCRYFILTTYDKWVFGTLSTGGLYTHHPTPLPLTVHSCIGRHAPREGDDTPPCAHLSQRHVGVRQRRRSTAFPSPECVRVSVAVDPRCGRQ